MLRKRIWTLQAVFISFWGMVLPVLSHFREGKYSLNTCVLGEKGMEKLWPLTGTPCSLTLGVSSTMFAIAGNKHNNNKKKLKPFRYSCATHTASLHTAWWHAVIGADCCTLKFYTENNTKNVPISKGSYHFFRKSEGNIWQRKQKIQTICPCRYSVSVPFRFP